MMRAAFFALLLATPAFAQTDAETIDKLADQYGDFAPAVEEEPLDELLPETDEPAGEADAQDGDTQADVFAVEPSPTESAQATPADPGAADIPEGWTRHEALGLTFAVPSDWKVMREKDDIYVVAAPGTVPRERKGLGLGIQTLDHNDSLKGYVEDESFSALLQADPRPALVVGPGIAFDRFIARPEQTGESTGSEGVVSPYRHAEYGHHLVSFQAFDPALLDDKAALIERIYATIRVADAEAFRAATTRAGPDGVAPAEQVTTLGGLFTVRPPEGWELHEDEEEVTLRTETVWSAYVTLRRGETAREELGGRRGSVGMLSRFQGVPEESAANILGQPARLYSGPLPYKGMQVGRSIDLRGQAREYVLERCLPDGSPVMIEMAAPERWLEDNDLQAVLDNIEPHWPDGMQECHPAITARAEFALDGLFAFVPPEGFETGRSRSAFRIRTKDDPHASLNVGTGGDSFPSVFQLSSSNSLGNGFLAPPETRRTQIMGEPATLFAGRGARGDDTGARQVALLDKCLPGDEPVVVEARADDAWLDANDGIEALLDDAWLLLPEDARPCDPGLLKTAMEVSRAGDAPRATAEPGAEMPEPVAPRAAEAPRADTAAETQADGPAAASPADGRTPPGWIRYEKFGLSVALPPDWTVARDDATDFTAIAPGHDRARRVGLGLDIRMLDAEEVARPLLTDPAVRDVFTASGIETLPVAPGVDFITFVVDNEAFGSSVRMYWAVSQHRFPGGHPLVGFGALDKASFENNRALMDRILDTLRLVDRQAFLARGTLVGPGLGTPEDPAAAPARPAPQAEPSTATTPAGGGVWQAVGDPVTGGIDSKMAVGNGPSAPTTFRLARRAMIDRITTYHWNHGQGAAPGTIALRDESGQLYGPWPAYGSEGQGGVPDAYWHVEPGMVLPGGLYTVVDSDPSTWATNADVDNRGIFTVEIRRVVRREAQQAPAAPAPSPSPSGYYTPARGTDERAALMDAARVPVQRELGQPVIFKVSRLRSDGTWAYLEATPLQPDGRPLDWSRTPMAEAWAADMMSDLVLLVLRRDPGGWRVVEHVIGPTDVAWVGWMDRYGWPRVLFAD